MKKKLLEELACREKCSEISEKVFGLVKLMQAGISLKSGRRNIVAIKCGSLILSFACAKFSIGSEHVNISCMPKSIQNTHDILSGGCARFFPHFFSG